MNFVAHLEHSLPNDVIGVSDATYKSLSSAEQESCVNVGKFENREVFIFSRDPNHGEYAKAACQEKLIQSKIGRLCVEDGLVDFEFRDAHHKALPIPAIYGQARHEILIFGVTLATSLKQEDQLLELRAASKRGVRLCFLMRDPETVGAPFSTGLNSIDEAMSALRSELENKRLNKSTTSVRGVLELPHFTGIMIDGNVNAPFSVETPSSPNSTLLLRIQPAIPPDVAKSQHFAPVLQYKRAVPSPTIMAYMRGFRYYWQTARMLV